MIVRNISLLTMKNIICYKEVLAMDINGSKNGKRKRSIYTNMMIRAFCCGYLLIVCIFLRLNVSSLYMMNFFRVYCIISIVACIFCVRFPCEVEDEMVHKLYAKANAWSDKITTVGLLVFLCLTCKQGQQVFSISLPELMIYISGLIFTVSIVRIFMVFFYSKRGI